MAFLNEIGHRQAVMAEAGCQRDDKAHMGSGQLMKCSLVPMLFPAQSKLVLLFSFEKRCIHGSSDEPAANP